MASGEYARIPRWDELTPEEQARLRAKAKNMKMDAEKMYKNAGRITEPPTGALKAKHDALQESIRDLMKKD